MFTPPLPRSSTSIASLLLGLAIAVAPANASPAARARLVHCGAESCLRLSGHRTHATTAILIGGRAVAVEGARTWRVTVPLATARAWTTASRDVLTLTLADTSTGTERVERVALPPGALGRRVELATLLVRAR